MLMFFIYMTCCIKTQMRICVRTKNKLNIYLFFYANIAIIMGILISPNYKLYCENHHTHSVTEFCIAMYNFVIANLFQT